MKKMYLRSPAGNLPSLKAAVDAGADAVYIGFNSATNLRNFPGLNFSRNDMEEGIAYAHSRNRQVYIVLNINPQSSQMMDCMQAVDSAVEFKADAVIIADIGLIDYCRSRYPDLRIHLSVQAGAASAEAIHFWHREFNVASVVLPRVLSLKEIRTIRDRTTVELEAFAFGSLCANYEGRCYLSSYLTGKSANSFGACSPAEDLEFEETAGGNLRFMLNNIVLNEYSQEEICSYPTPCKGRWRNTATRRSDFSFQESLSLNVLPMLDDLAEAGVNAIKIEGRQRSLIYVKTVTGIFRKALDGLPIEHEWEEKLLAMCEGMCSSSGCLQEV